MSRSLGAIAGLVLILAGCKAPVGLNIAPTGISSSARTTASAGLPVIVNAPNSLASNGQIVSADLSQELAAGGGHVIAAGGANVIAAGGANVIAAGGANVIAAGGANYRVGDYGVLSASVDSYIRVVKAAVELEDLNGNPLSNVLYTDQQGQAIIQMPSNQPSLAVTIFKVNGKVYRFACDAMGANGQSVYADPINTMVEARVRQVLAAHGNLAALDPMKLKQVWQICNDADVQVDLSAFQTTNDPKNNGSVDQLVNFYKQAISQVQTWEQAGNASAPTPKTQMIKDFMASLQGASPAPSPSGSASASASAAASASASSAPSASPSH